MPAFRVQSESLGLRTVARRSKGAPIGPGFNLNLMLLAYSGPGSDSDADMIASWHLKLLLSYNFKLKKKTRNSLQSSS